MDKMQIVYTLIVQDLEAHQYTYMYHFWTQV